MRVPANNPLSNIQIRQRISADIENQRRQLAQDQAKFTPFLQNVEPFHEPPVFDVRIVERRRMFEGALKVFEVTTRYNRMLHSFRHHTRKAILEEMDKF